MTTIEAAQTNTEKYFERLQRIYDQSQSATTSTAEDFITRCSKIEDYYPRFEDACERFRDLQLEAAENASEKERIKKQFLERCKAYDELYTKVKLVLNACIRIVNKAEDAKAEASKQRSRNPCSVKLPKISLHQFDGTLNKWSVFYENFKALIHDNDSLSPVEKFHYLISSLSGPALSFVKTLPITPGNYIIVWTNLTNHYQDPRALGTTLVDAILNLPPIQTTNSATLNNLVTVLHDSVESLKTLGLDSLDDFILLNISLKKLPIHQRRHFENTHIKTQIPTFKTLMEYLRDQTRVATLTETTKREEQTIPRSFRPRTADYNQKSKIYLTNEDAYKSRACPMCAGAHPLYMCEKFKNLKVEERVNKVNSLKCCSNCLARSHQQAECFSKFHCKICQKKHHTLLCYQERKNFSAIEVHLSENKVDNTSHQQTCLAAKMTPASVQTQNSTTLLGTAIIEVKDAAGKYQTVRAVIDPGAMSTFISEDCARRLNLRFLKVPHYISGLSDQKVQSIGAATCWIKPRQTEKPEFFIRSVILPCITDYLPCIAVSTEIKQTWADLELADPNFDIPNKIDMLLGAEIFPFIYTGPKQITEKHGSALKSIFGWVITGRTFNSICNQVSPTFMSLEDKALNDLMTKFWLVEEPQIQIVENPDHKTSEELFQKEHYRDSTGRYVVPLLLKSDEPCLSDSYHLAMKRLITMENKLQKSPETQKAYAEFLEEYENLGHMEEVKVKGKARYYIPHHCVIREGSLTTKHRVVFDASMITSKNGISLNSTLYTGPKLQADIVEIILRFRTHRIALTADICKMFRQILIRPQDRKYQHILWKKNENEPVKEYELCTVTYGTSSAPYLANRSVKQLNIDEGDNFPEVTQILDTDIYVDDILTGGDTIKEVVGYRDSLSQMLKKGGFDLKKWSSSHSEVLEGLNEADIALHPEYFEFELENSASLGVLGLRWSPNTDTFSYNEVEFDLKVTKRSILSNIARIFDPAGWITGVVLSAKIIIQRLWIAGLNWDDKVPEDIAHAWTTIQDQLPLLNTIKIPRLICNPDSKELTLIGFSDGSMVGYGATVYIRTKTDQGYQSNLFIAKSKVAPTKTLTVPRLELCGAQLLAKIMQVAQKALSCTNYIVTKIIALTDSVTVLSWLTTPPFKLKTYAANRVVDTLEKIPAEYWMHVSTHDNPADIASRGILPKELVNNKMWWSGPNWLQEPINDWKVSSIHAIQKVNPPELKQDKLKVFISETAKFQLINRFSSLQKLQRVTAWCFRFYENSKYPLSAEKKRQHPPSAEKKHQGPLTVQELNRAANSIIKHVQSQEFQKDLKHLKEGKQVNNNLLTLNPFLDNLGVLRVGGRLSHSQLEQSEKHPAILPKNHHLTNLVIDHYHERHCHAGPRLLQSIICQNFWIISARRIIRSRLRKCVRCFKAAPRNHNPKMGDLPSCRVTPTRCFLKVGTDYGGPVLIKEGSRKNAKFHKAYICLFICMATKALHLELVSNLTTEAFIAALDRMTARRGLCDELFSDCGTNYVGAKRYLNELHEYLSSPSNQEKLKHQLTDRKINWNLNPPSAPHFGGLWEAGIKSVKYHLQRTIGEQHLSFEEYSTLLTKIEAILNSRPLCALSSDTEDLNVLTPAHLLVGTPLLSLPEYDWTLEPSNRLSRWQQIQQLAQTFWQRWSKEYLNTLQQRQRWLSDTEELSVGDIVVVKDDNSPPLQWRLGRITALYPGADKVSRVATIYVNNKTMQRPAVKLCRLPLN